MWSERGSCSNCLSTPTFSLQIYFSTRTRKELAARRVIKRTFGRKIKIEEKFLDEKSLEYKKMIECIRKELGVTTLIYQSIEQMVKAIGLPKKRLCLYCWKGGG